MNLSFQERHNITEPTEDVEPTMASDIHKAIFCVVYFLSLLLNVTNCVFSCRIAHLKPIWPNILSVQLQAADLSALVIGITIAVVAFFIDGLLSDCIVLCKFQAIILNVWYITTLLLVLSISLDRMFAITFPFAYSKKIQSHQVRVAPVFSLLIVLVLALFIACLPLMLGNPFTTLGPGVYCLWDASDSSTLPVVVINVVFVVVVMVMLTIITFQICVGILKLLSARVVAPTRQQNVPSSKSSDKTEVNFAKLAIVIALTTAISCCPFTVTLIITASSDYGDLDVQYITFSFLLLSLLVNPIIHGLVRRPIRNGYLHLISWTMYYSTCGYFKPKPSRSFDEVLGLARKQWQPPTDLTRQQQQSGTPAVSSNR